MKTKENFLLRQIANTWVVMPLAEKTLNFDGMLTLNETGVMLWNLLVAGSDREKLANALVAEYQVSFEQAIEDVDAYLAKLDHYGCLEHEA